MQKKVGLIVQARLGSSRLPRKILLSVKSKPIFQYQINRLRDVGYPIIVATTSEIADEAIVDFARDNNLDFFRGSETNVLERFYQCAKHFDLDVVVRLTSDCPLIDPLPIKESIFNYLKENNDQLYLSNSLSRTYPRGFDFEIFSFQLLEIAYMNATDNWDKEHVTPYIGNNKSGNVKIKQVVNKENNSRFRLTLDTPEDFDLLRSLIEQFDADILSGPDIVNILKTHPELVSINEHIKQKTSPSN